MDFDDLIMKEKPKVSWGEVIGLEDAKRAIRESIVYPTKRPESISTWLAQGHFIIWTARVWQDASCAPPSPRVKVIS